MNGFAAGYKPPATRWKAWSAWVYLVARSFTPWRIGQQIELLWPVSSPRHQQARSEIGPSKVRISFFGLISQESRLKRTTKCQWRQNHKLCHGYSNVVQYVFSCSRMVSTYGGDYAIALVEARHDLLQRDAIMGESQSQSLFGKSTTRGFAANVSAAKQRRQKGKTAVYPIPASFLQGRLAEMLFWDAVYYLLATKGETNAQGHCFVETTYAEIQSVADLTRKTLRKQIDLAATLPEPFRLYEEEGIRPYAFVLKLKQISQQATQSKIILKSTAYVENGWAWLLGQPYPGATKKTRLPLAVMNVLFRRPHGRTAAFAEIVQRCKNKRKPPDAADVEKAIAYLLRLELIEEPEPRFFRLLWPRFAADARPVYRKLQEPETAVIHDDLMAWARAQDATRAQQAAELIVVGQLDFVRDFKTVFYDLGSIQQANELELLTYVVHRKRAYRLSRPDRWQAMWRAFERKLAKEQFATSSAKLQVDLAQQQQAELPLTLAQHYPKLLRWGKLVLWVNDARYQFCRLKRPEKVQISLHRAGQQLCAHDVQSDDGVVRCDLTADLRQVTEPTYNLRVKAERPLRQFKIEAMLEAEYLNRQTG